MKALEESRRPAARRGVFSRSLRSMVSGALAAVALSALGQQADKAKPYHYVSLDAALPASFDFLDFPVKVTESRAVYATAYVCGEFTCDPTVVVYRQGTFEVLGSGIAYTANERGAAAGSILTDPDNYIEQAAIFEDGNTELIPRLPGEATSRVMQLTDSGIALVASSTGGDAPESSLYLFIVKRHRVVPLDLGPDQLLYVEVNDRGNLGGTSFIPSLGARGFRYDVSSGTKTLLEPTATETDAYGRHIDDRERVLGYSFVPNGVERIGWWNREGKFPKPSSRARPTCRRSAIRCCGTTRDSSSSPIRSRQTRTAMSCRRPASG